MGCRSSKHKYSPNFEIPGQDSNILPLLETFGIDEGKDIDTFYTVFCEMDIHKTGFVRPVELYTYFGIDFGSLEAALFNIFDDTKSGKLTFVEFVCAMWNLLTTKEEDLSIFMYLMRDPTGVMRIKYADIMNVLEIVHKRRVDSAPALSMLYNDAKAKLSSETSLGEFVKWSSYNLSMVSPMLILQIKLRKRLLGEKFWVAMMDRRYSIPEQVRPDFTKKIQLAIAKINAETKEKKVKHDKDKLVEVKASLSASQKNIQAKETAVLQSLMKRTNSSVAPLIPSSSSKKIDTTAEDEVELDSPAAGKKSKKPRPSSATPSTRQQAAIASTTRPGSAKSRPSSAKKNISFKEEATAASSTGKTTKDEKRKSKREKQGDQKQSSK